LSQILTGKSVWDELALMGLVLNTFDDLVDHGRAVMSSPVAVIDEFEDATGIDAAGSSGETYNAAGYFHNTAGGIEGTFSAANSGTNSCETPASAYYGLMFPNTAAGDVSAVKANVATVSTSGTYHLEIWTESAGSPSAQVGGDSDGVVISATGDVIFTWSASAPTLSAATDYWALIVCDSGNVNFNNVADQGASYKSGRATTATGITDGAGAFNGDAKIEITVTASPPAFDLRSVGVALGITPASGFFVGKFSVSDPDAVYVSSDDGTTWDEVALTDHGDYGSGISVFSGSVSVTGGGSTARIRATKASGTECRVQAWGAVFGT